MKFFFSIFLISIVTAGSQAVAQRLPVLKASVDRNRILIGEPFGLTIEMKAPPGSKPEFIIPDSIDHFEFLATPRVDTIAGPDGTVIRGTCTLTSFDSGHWVIPSFRAGAARTDTLPMDVGFSEFDPNQDYHDIKDILGVKQSKPYPWWPFAAGGALLLFLVLYFILRKKKKPLAQAVPALSTDPFGDAMEQLQELQRSNPGYREFHIRLTGIFRLFLFRKMGILSLQETTGDLVVQLASLYRGEDWLGRLSQSLRLSDFVKFAKYAPAEEENRDAWETIRQAILRIEKPDSGTTSGSLKPGKG